MIDTKNHYIQQELSAVNETLLRDYLKNSYYLIKFDKIHSLNFIY